MSNITKDIKSINLLSSLIFEMLKNHKNISDDIDNNYKICQEISRKIINKNGVNIEVVGQDNIPQEDSVLIASNHRSFYDIMILLSSIDKTMSFASAKELFKYPILRDYIESIKCVNIDRETEDFKVIKEQLAAMADALKNGNLILFPEGQCNYENDNVNEFKRGGFMSIAKTDCSIVPTYINMEQFKKIGRWIIPIDNVSVHFGEAFKPKDVFPKRVKADELANYTREKVLSLKRELTR